MKLETATLAGGCFWCLEAVYEQVNGVHKVVSGYAGGSVPDPSYELVCTGLTGHAEVVQITFDSNVVSFEGLLKIFFVIHDPTTLNRQGADVGTQYRSAIFFESEEQRIAADEFISTMSEFFDWANPIVTTLEPLTDLYEAEHYHQGYFRNNPELAYCKIVIEPKVAKLRKEFLPALK
tara:strand:+ start:392 stop:925 length:534 start_codon:yes stop_codon:yes gene_type:complete